MPAMTFQKGGRGVVSGNHQDVGFQPENRREEPVYLLNALYLHPKIPIFPSHVGFLEMDIEKVVSVKMFLQRLHFRLDGIPRF